MQTSNDEQAYCYEPLPDPNKYIRLLKVNVDVSQEATFIKCDLVPFTLAGAPRYYAMSYTWGDPNETPSSILVNERRMEVRRNCAEALKQAWRYNRARDAFFWIDSVCINQGDIAEMNAQVSIMGLIYRKCACVLACVGGHADDSDFLYKTLREAEAALCEYVRCLASFSCMLEEGPEYWHTRDKERKEGWRKISLVIPCEEEKAMENTRCSQALRKFLGRPYFSRLWIYQELALGPAVTVCCGFDFIPAQLLYGLAEWIEDRYTYVWTRNFRSDSPNAYDWISRMGDGDGAVDFQLMPMLDSIIKGKPRTWDSGKPTDLLAKRYRPGPVVSRVLPLLKAAVLPGDRKMPLLELFDVIREARLQCQDSRDKCFGILAMVDWGSCTPIRPDYERGTYDVAWEVMKRIHQPPDDIDDIPASIITASKMVEMFRLTSVEPSPRLEQEIKKRRRLLLDTMLEGAQRRHCPTNRHPSPQGLRTPKYKGYAFEVTYEDGIWGLRTRSWAKASRVLVQRWPEYTSSKFSHQNMGVPGPGRNLGFLLPQVTQPGDWCVVNYPSPGGSGPTRHKFHGKDPKECGVLFIARPSTNTSHSIIGKGLWYNFPGEKDIDGIYRIFSGRADALLHIDLEDALVLACYPEPFTGGPPERDERLAEFMETAVCGEMGSSFMTVMYLWDEVYDVPV